MALDSIAKLSVLITGDETPLTHSMRRAEQAVAGSTQRMNSSSTQLSTVLSAARGNIPALFKVAGGAALVLAGTATAAYRLAAAGDRLNEMMGASKLDTWAGQWSRVKDSLALTAGIVGGPLAIAFRDFTAEFAALTERTNNWLFPQRMEEWRRRQAQLSALEQEAVKLKIIDDPNESNEQRLRRLIDEKKAEQQAKIAEAAKRAAAELAKVHEKERDALSEYQKTQFARADAIRSMVRTPGEELRRFTIEMKSLFTSGFIDQETMNRALEMAEQKARDAVNIRRGAADSANRSVGAAERFTVQGHTAVAEAQQRQQHDAEQKKIAQAQLTEQQKMANLLQHIRESLASQPNYEFVFGNLN